VRRTRGQLRRTQDDVQRLLEHALKAHAGMRRRRRQKSDVQSVAGDLFELQLAAELPESDLD
jgi:hypothetical protein